MQLGLHNDRMTVETKNYNVETKNKYLLFVFAPGLTFQTHMPSVLYLKKLISKKTYQHINFVRPKGCEHRFRKSAEDFFLCYFSFFLHIVIVLRKIEIKKIYIFSSFCFEFSYPNSFWPMQGFGEAGIGKNGMVIKTLIIKMKYLTTLLI